MDIEELARILSQMYTEGNEDNRRAAMVHLFGIRYSRVIRENGFNPKEILAHTRLENGEHIPDTYYAEINKGINLSEYVVDRERIRELLD